MWWYKHVEETELCYSLQHLFGGGFPVHSLLEFLCHWLCSSLVFPIDKCMQKTKETCLYCNKNRKCLGNPDKNHAVFLHSHPNNSPTKYLYTHCRSIVDNRGVMKSIREHDDWVTLVCVIPVPVSHSDLQSYVFLRRGDDCNAVLSKDMTSPPMSVRQSSITCVALSNRTQDSYLAFEFG